ncbi:hypothetical protein ACB092_02G154900 [Castanea dentata]
MEFPNTLYLILSHSPPPSSPPPVQQSSDLERGNLILPHSLPHSVGIAFCRRHHHLEQHSHRGHPRPPSLPQPPDTPLTEYKVVLQSKKGQPHSPSLSLTLRRPCLLPPTPPPPTTQPPQPSSGSFPP